MSENDLNSDKSSVVGVFRRTDAILVGRVFRVNGGCCIHTLAEMLRSEAGAC